MYHVLRLERPDACVTTKSLPWARESGWLRCISHRGVSGLGRGAAFGNIFPKTKNGTLVLWSKRNRAQPRLKAFSLLSSYTLMVLLLKFCSMELTQAPKHKLLKKQQPPLFLLWTFSVARCVVIQSVFQTSVRFVDERGIILSDIFAVLPGWGSQGRVYIYITPKSHEMFLSYQLLFYDVIINPSVRTAPRD